MKVFGMEIFALLMVWAGVALALAPIIDGDILEIEIPCNDTSDLPTTFTSSTTTLPPNPKSLSQTPPTSTHPSWTHSSATPLGPVFGDGSTRAVLHSTSTVSSTTHRSESKMPTTTARTSMETIRVTLDVESMPTVHLSPNLTVHMPIPNKQETTSLESTRTASSTKVETSVQRLAETVTKHDVSTKFETKTVTVPLKTVTVDVEATMSPTTHLSPNLPSAFADKPVSEPHSTANTHISTSAASAVTHTISMSPNVAPTPSTSHVAGDVPTPVPNMDSLMATTVATSVKQSSTSWNSTGSMIASGWTGPGSGNLASSFVPPTGIPQKFGEGNRAISIVSTNTYEPSANSTCSLTFKHKPNVFGCVTTHWASTTTVSLPCSGCHTTDITKAVFDSVFEQLHGGSLYACPTSAHWNTTLPLSTRTVCEVPSVSAMVTPTAMTTTTLSPLTKVTLTKATGTHAPSLSLSPTPSVTNSGFVTSTVLSPRSDSDCIITFTSTPEFFGCIHTKYLTTVTSSTDCWDCKYKIVTKALFDSAYEQVHGTIYDCPATYSVTKPTSHRTVCAESTHIVQATQATVPI